MFKISKDERSVGSLVVFVVIFHRVKNHEMVKVKGKKLLCKVISTYSGSSLMSHAVWVVFVSTTSKVANFAMASQKLRMPYFHQFRSPFILIETDRQFRAGSSNGRVVVSTVHISWLGSECIPL